MIEVKREDNETIDHLLRKYQEQLKNTGAFKRVKESAVCSKKPNKRQKKKSALYKLRKKKKMDYFKRIGKVKKRFS